MEDSIDIIKESSEARRKRKKEAKLLKRKRIEDAGGTRPRPEKSNIDDDDSEKQPSRRTKPSQRSHQEHGQSSKKRQSKSRQTSSSSNQAHRFGRVMESVPTRNRPRLSTLSIAIPASVVSNCQTRELKTHLVGQIARAAAIYHVDEIVVFDDKLSVKERSDGQGFAGSRRYHRDQNRRRDMANDSSKSSSDPPRSQQSLSDPHTFMARLLQYCECPQYLRRQFFPMHPDLQFAGLLSPLDAPHHVREGDRSKYREGVVMEPRENEKTMKFSLVNCGIRGRPVLIDRLLQPGVRCTVAIDDYASTGRIRGRVVSPSAPREDDGTYWGYTTRLADSIGTVFEESPFGSYDLKIGTSERGHETVDDKEFCLPTFKHALIVFGGVAGLEECVDADESMKISGSQCDKLFDLWVNVCPFQGSRTIRTEEAVLLTLARFSPFVAANDDGKSDRRVEGVEGTDMKRSETDLSTVQFSDASVSDESSDGDDST